MSDRDRLINEVAAYVRRHPGCRGREIAESCGDVAWHTFLQEWAAGVREKPADTPVHGVVYRLDEEGRFAFFPVVREVER